MKLKIYFIGWLWLLIAGCTCQYPKILYKQKPAFYSYIFGDVASKQIGLQHSAEVYATPASCQKVITALLAYKLFGNNYQYETKLYATKINNKIQDVIIKFSGDPLLTSENLINLLSVIKNYKINGQIILDMSLFKTPYYSSCLMIDDMGTEYGQPVSSANIDQNLIKIIIDSDKIIKIKNDAGYLINSNVTITENQSLIKLKEHNSVITVTGNINSEDKLLEFNISPKNLEQYILNKIKKITKFLNITVKINVITDHNKLPFNLILLNSIKSEALNNFIPIALKQSNNLVFDALYLNIIHSLGDLAKTEEWHHGDDIIKSLINQHFKVDVTNARFVDGSGLSRYNLIQPKQLFEILKNNYLNNDFIAALAHPGELASSLEYRNNLSNNIKAKTGNMSGISCLCGYSMNHKDNKPKKAFVIMTNSFGPPSQEMFVVMDEFVSYIVK